MIPNELRELIKREEDPKLEFKSEFYRIDDPNERVQKIHSDELIKDVLALANGAFGHAREKGYLIIGVGSRLHANGTRDLYDTSAVKVNSARLLQKINSACHPPLSELLCEIVSIDGRNILVITIPPSPFLHETTREMGEHKEYPKNTVFVRRGDSIGTATQEECRAIEREKKKLFAFGSKPTLLLGENRSLDFINDPAILAVRLFGSEHDDTPLAHHNIPYQQRDPNRDIQRELRSALNSTRYLLITAPTGIGKTREAATLAQTLMSESYRVVRVKSGNVEIPREFPVELCDNPHHILILLDDLNFLFRSGEPVAPPRSDDLSTSTSESCHDRLLKLLNAFKKWCGESEIRVIATARDEPEMWQSLNFSPRDPLWKRFTRYPLPVPSDGAIVKLLEESTARANLQAKPQDFNAIARRNDGKFSTIVENLRTAQRENKTVTLGNFAGTLDNFWRDQYEEILRGHPAVRYIYDAVDWSLELHKMVKFARENQPQSENSPLAGAKQSRAVSVFSSIFCRKTGPNVM